MTTLPGPGALPDGPGQRGHSTLRSAAPEPARGARLRLRGPRARIFIVFAALMEVFAASAVTTGQDRVHQQLAAPQGRKHSLSDRWCPPGSHISEDGERCIDCTNGVDYTIHWNKLFSCLPCAICKSDRKESVPCTRTKNTQCQCEPGTYLGEDSPEFCQKCSTGCPDGMVESEPCTPWSNIKCVKQESGNSQLVMGIVLGAMCGVLLLIVCAYNNRRRIRQGCGVDPECLNKVFFWRLCPPRGPGTLDNARNETKSNTDLLITQIPEQELGHREHTEPEDVLLPSPEEAEPLLEPAGAEGSQMRRGLLVPVNDADPIESLRLFFDYFTNVVPFNSWNPLMRLLGLSDNDIQVTRAQVSNPKEALYEMLVTWLNIKGRAASVNNLLKALETLGERCAKELIQDRLVSSGKYVYEEGGAGSALS